MNKNQTDHDKCIKKNLIKIKVIAVSFRKIYMIKIKVINDIMMRKVKIILINE